MLQELLHQPLSVLTTPEGCKPDCLSCSALHNNADARELYPLLKLLQCLRTKVSVLQREGASRDVLLLDIALDNYFRLCLERTDKAALSADALCDLVELVLRNTVIAYDSNDFRQVRRAASPLRSSEAMWTLVSSLGCTALPLYTSLLQCRALLKGYQDA